MLKESGTDYKLWGSGVHLFFSDTL